MIGWGFIRCESTGPKLIEVIEVTDQQGKAPVEQPAPVEPTRSRRGRRKLEDVEVDAAKAATKATAQANAAKTRAKTQTALLKEKGTQAEIKAQLAEKAKAARKRANARRWADFKTRAGATGRTAMTVGPIVAPMSIAWTGQIGFAGKVLNWPFAGGVGYAAAYELTIIFTAWMYHEARKDGDSGAGYRLLTWIFAIGNGVQQWWHWSDNWNATPRAVTYSIMTAIGVIVWEAYARLIHRRKLRADGKLGGSRPAIGWLRWLRYPRISFTAWSGTIRHGFESFTDMWTWAEVEREGKRTRRDKIRTQRARIKELEKELADFRKATKGSVIQGEVERVATPDPEPIPAAAPELDPGPRHELEAADPGSPEPNPGDDDHTFQPTNAEIQAVKEMVEAKISLNRANVMDYIRDNDNRRRLGQPEGIATKRAALVAKWGRDNHSKIKAVS